MLIRVTFLRHAQSMQNLGFDVVDAPLSPHGMKTANQTTVDGAELILLSPLRRALQTYAQTQIRDIGVTPVLQICPEARERKDSKGCLMIGESVDRTETDVEFHGRMLRLIECIQQQSAGFRSVLVVSHASVIHAIVAKCSA